MPARKRTSTAPQLDQIVLPALRAGDPDELASGADLDAVEFADLSLDHVDLAGARLEASRLSGVRAAEADLRGIVLTETVIALPDVPVVRGARSGWRDVRVDGGRLGSVELYESELRSVEFVGAKLTFVNLRGATLQDVRFADCVIDELDLGGVEALRVALPGTRIRRLDVSGATLRHVDLRGCDFDEIVGVESLSGAVIDEGQLLRIAPVLAAQMGIVVEG